MSRFHSARQLIAKAFALDPENGTGKSIEKRIDYAMSALKGVLKSNQFPEELRGNGARRKRNELVMVVDQDEKVLLAMTDRLRREGFEVVCAASYNEAVETLTTITPGIIISEVNFDNGPAGLDLFLWVKTNIDTAGTPFMYLATKIDRDTLVCGKRLGVDDFILKPLDEDILIASIMQCLRRQRRREL
jgi:PleD family two-component response regulator